MSQPVATSLRSSPLHSSPLCSTLLHSALKDELQQLEPLFLPLFGRGRSSREPNAAPTARTHAALKLLVALTRYFPEEHRVRKAGKQLEMIWAPLVHEPRGSVAGKLLYYYFRVRQDLLDTPQAALRLAMQNVAAGGIDAALSRQSAARSACYVQQLQRLAVFVQAIEGAPPAVPSAPAHMTPLARLFRWQQELALADANDTSTPVARQVALAPYLQDVREHCAELCAASNWSLDYFCQSGLAHGLWQLRGLAVFAGDVVAAARLEALGDECLDMHLAPRWPEAEVLQGWLARLLAGDAGTCVLRGGRTPHTPSESDPGLHGLYTAELARYQQQLASALVEPAPLHINVQLLTLLYKATWLFAAAGRSDWSRLCHCAYRVAVQFWRIKRPVTAAGVAVLRCMALAIAREPGVFTPAPQLRSWRQQLLQDWPCWASNGKRPIALQTGVELAVPLDAVPQLLSGSFATLVRLPAHGCAAAPNAGTCSQLLQELVLLEQGAAAMKVWPLEQLCSLLIGVYEAYLREGALLPAMVLDAAHRQLVCMLDQSANWQEAQEDGALVQALEDWLAQRSFCREPLPANAVHTGDSGTELLRADLLAYLGTLASVLERPVRLRLETGGVRLDAVRVAQVLESLKPLVKFMLLDRSVDARGRHAMHKPRVSTLTVTLRATSATLVLSAAEDSHEDPLPHVEVQRLQRRLPKTAGALVCESRAGQGRCFTFTLS